MIITIDGPSASGKSTIAGLLAQQRGWMHLNSGLLFRAVAYIFIKRSHKLAATDHDSHHSRGLDISNLKTMIVHHPELLSTQSLEKMITDEKLHYRFVKDKGAEVLINHEQITPFLKTPEIDAAASIIATHASVRQVLLDFQHKLCDHNNVIADGRDCGTVVFPHAQYKFFLTASLEVRAARHGCHLGPDQQKLSFEECLRLVSQRDERDSKRSVAPLQPANDAYVIDSSHMSVQDVIDEIIDVIGMP